jgi:hypothetical protein
MAHLLKRGPEEFSLNAWDWGYLLKMAKAYGWAPTDPLHVDKTKAITAQEARGLVASLEKALPLIPTECTISDDQGLSTLPDDPLDWFSGDGRIVVRHFIAFCRGGGFQVE